MIKGYVCNGCDKDLAESDLGEEDPRFTAILTTLVLVPDPDPDPDSDDTEEDEEGVIPAIFDEEEKNYRGDLCADCCSAMLEQFGLIEGNRRRKGWRRRRRMM